MQLTECSLSERRPHSLEPSFDALDVAKMHHYAWDKTDTRGNWCLSGVCPSLAESDLERELNILSNTYLDEGGEDDIRPDVSKSVDQLVVENLNYARLVAGSFVKYGSTLEDLTQEAFMGMTMAARRYNPHVYKTKFITFAKSYILLRIRKCLNSSNNLIKTPESYREQYKKIKSKIDEFEAVNERQPRMDELSKMTGLSTNVLERTLRHKHNGVLSMDEVSHRMDGDVHMEDIIILSDPEPNPYEAVARMDDLNRVLEQSSKILTELEMLVVRRKIFEEMTFEQIGKEIDRSISGTKVILLRGLDKLRRCLEGGRWSEI